MHTFALFFAVSLLATATPGPAILYVTSQGVSGGLRSAIPSSFGILAADAFYILLSITGLTAILVASYELFLAIKWVGAVYLVCFGLRLIRAGLGPLEVNPSVRSVPPSRSAFLGGFVLHAGNPKALLYFGSLVPQFIDQARPVAGQLVALAAIHLLTASLVLGVYSALATLFRRSAAGTRVRRLFHLGSGSFLIGAGVSLVFARKGSP